MAFRLERIVRLRTRLRELRAAEFAEEKARLRGLQESLEHTRRLRTQSLEEEGAMTRTAPVDDAVFQTGRAWVQGLEIRERQLLADIASAEETITAKRQEVLMARQEEDKLVHVEERHAIREAAEIERQGAVALDEFAQQAHRRRQREGSEDDA